MTWFRLDDGFALHAKVITAGNAAVGLWVRACCWSSAQLTDGMIPVAVARTLGTTKEAAALEAAGLWTRDGARYIIPDWLDYQPAASTVREQQRIKSEAKRAAGRIGGLRSGEARAKQTASTDEANGEANGKRNEAPTRPDPTPLLTSHDDDDSEMSEHESSSSVDQVLKLVVAGLAHEAFRVNHPGWRASTMRNQRAENGPAIAQALAEGHDEFDIAARFCDPVHLRLAMNGAPQ